MLELLPAVRSDVGRRTNNEDSAFASRRLAAVADGVGGHAAGEVASRAAIDALILLDKCRPERPLRDELEGAVRDGNDRIRFLVECRPQYAGMGTTLSTVALAGDGTYVVANIGDSRAYLLREGRLRQLTRDDSLLQDLIDAGTVRAEEAQRHPLRNVVKEVLDGDARRAPRLQTLPAAPGDRLLLCSDGVTDVLDDAVLVRALNGTSREEAAQRLVRLALDAGSRDNVTAVVADVVDQAA